MTPNNSDFLNAPATDTKSHLLATGYKLLANKGFTAVGIKQILDTAGIPKGSFYHYFASKEAFGEAIIKGYFEHYKNRLQAISNQDITAQQKLHSYFQYWYDTQQTSCDHEKCLVVKLSGEVSDISDPMREALAGGYMQTIHWISEQIEAGWKDGSVPTADNLSAMSIAKRWYYAWLGASLIAKTSRTNDSLTEVWQMTVSELGL
ncbi:TetR/AcrR family transcriptional regulator [Psychrobacter sp. FDAARGOS_221]|uniref:TetR/AcrR family transcriptional regulator n=1 Tax=Psychrobacter sp. FDAARGOS_221 TaxID=1975705 RepID=UPI000BB5491C|nr:TetR/AcrR family transcriptional regulator [Psychrobacter sp. FDAARGOS_221]PNK59565.1 TetR/AcrR family transcriptional regulator [Psychrobacter sp. FDAARGOS_221]